MRGALTAWVSVARDTAQGPSLSLLKYRGCRASRSSRLRPGPHTVSCGPQYLWTGELEGGRGGREYFSNIIYSRIP